MKKQWFWLKVALLLYALALLGGLGWAVTLLTTDFPMDLYILIWVIFGMAVVSIIGITLVVLAP